MKYILCIRNEFALSWFWFVHQMQNTCGAYVHWMHKMYTYTIINGPLPRPGCDFSFFRLQSGVTLKHNGMRFHKTVQKSGRINMKTHIWHWNEIEHTTTASASACTSPKYQCHLKCFLFWDIDVIVWLLKSRLMVHLNYDIPRNFRHKKKWMGKIFFLLIHRIDSYMHISLKENVCGWAWGREKSIVRLKDLFDAFSKTKQIICFALNRISCLHHGNSTKWFILLNNGIPSIRKILWLIY